MKKLFAIAFAVVLCFALGTVAMADTTTETGYLTFSSTEEFKLKTQNSSKNWDGTLWYSTDATNWTEWDGTEISSVGGKLYLRGVGNSKLTTGDDAYGYSFVLSGKEISCSGNIMTLLDHQKVTANETITMAEAAFAYLFKGNAELVSAPELPAGTATLKCYRGMFSECTKLTSAPELPATQLAAECYYEMFYKCTSLKTAPNLPAQTLGRNCYYRMFMYCTSLTQLPTISATSAATESCYAMFLCCSNIKLSETRTGDYQHPWSIPVTLNSNPNQNENQWNSQMLGETGGTFKGPVVGNTTYYQICDHNYVNGTCDCAVSECDCQAKLTGIDEDDNKLYNNGTAVTKPGEHDIDGKKYSVDEEGKAKPFDGTAEDGKFYQDGELFTGYLFGADDKLYYYTDGIGTLFTGEYEGKKYKDGVEVVPEEPEPEPQPQPQPKPEPCSHKLDENGKCSRCGVVIITHTEKQEAETNPNTGAMAIGLAALLGIIAR